MDFIDTSPSVISSSLGMYSFNNGLRTNAIIVHERACIPCVFEKISIINPMINEIVKT